MTSIYGARARVILDSGSLDNPSLTFGDEPTTGIYLDGSNPGSTEFTIVKRGTKRIRVEDDGVEIDNLKSGVSSSFADGTASAPSINFTSDTKTGIFRDISSTTGVGVSVGGSEIGFFNSGGLEMSGTYPVTTTEVFAPTTTYDSKSQTYTSFTSSGGGPPFNVSYVVEAQNVLTMQNNGGPILDVYGETSFFQPVAFSTTCQFSDGSSTAPALTFSSDTTSGLFKDTTGSGSKGVGVTVGSTEIAHFDSSGLNMDGTSQIKAWIGAGTSPGLAFESHTTSGLSYAISPPSLNLSTGGNTNLSVRGNLVLVQSDLQVSDVTGLQIQAPSGTSTQPGLSFTSATSSGWSFNTTSSLITASIGGTAYATNSSTSSSFAGSVLAASGTGTAPSLSFTSSTGSGFSFNTTSSLLSSSIGGTPVMTSSTTSTTFAGDLLYTFYNIVLDANATQNIGNNSIAAVTFNQIQKNNNFTFTTGTSTITIPVAGLYRFEYSVCWDSNATGTRNSWFSYNGGTRTFAYQSIGANGSDKTRTTGGGTWQMSASDTLVLEVYQTNTGLSALNIGSEATYCSVTRLHA
jgi:hypothetical protein